MKLKLINNLNFEDKKIIDKSFKYSLAAAREMIACSEKEIELWTFCLNEEGGGICNNQTHPFYGWV